VSVGSAPPNYSFFGMLYTIGSMISNVLWPRWLGGVDRPYLMVRSFASLPELERISKLAAEGLKVSIDSIWDLEDALKVCFDGILRSCVLTCNAGV
jgi:hypothetical protein